MLIGGYWMEFLYIILIVFFDQATKLLVRIKLKPDINVDIINGYFSLVYTKNQGAALGIFKNQRLILIGVTVLAIIIMGYCLIRVKKMNKWIKISFIFIIAGAIGNNLIDRIFLGYVVDFIHFHIKNIDLPVFNIADVCIGIGTFSLLINLIFTKPNKLSNK
jgi:signal peptidase II